MKESKQDTTEGESRSNSLLEQLFDKLTKRGLQHEDDYFEFDIGTASHFIDQNVQELGVQDSHAEVITTGFTRRIRSIYKELWGEYIPIEGLELKDLAVLRPVNTDEIGLHATEPTKHEGLNILQKVLSGSIRLEGYVQSVNNLRLMKVKGLGQSIVGHEKQLRNLIQTIARVKFGGVEAKAEDYLNRYIYISNTSHEAAHIYQDEELPEYFTELAARAYQSTVLYKLYGPTRPTSPRYENSTKIYNALIQKYGNDVHKLFFGSKIDPKIKRRILLDAGIREGIRWFIN